MNKEEIFNKVIDTTIDTMGLGKEEVKMESHFIEDLGCDSMLLSELIMLIEDEFDLKIPDQEAEKLKTIAQVVDYIYEKKYAPSSAKKDEQLSS